MPSASPGFPQLRRRFSLLVLSSIFLITAAVGHVFASGSVSAFALAAAAIGIITLPILIAAHPIAVLALLTTHALATLGFAYAAVYIFAVHLVATQTAFLADPDPELVADLALCVAAVLCSLLATYCLHYIRRAVWPQIMRRSTVVASSILAPADGARGDPQPHAVVLSPSAAALAEATLSPRPAKPLATSAALSATLASAAARRFISERADGRIADRDRRKGGLCHLFPDEQERGVDAPHPASKHAHCGGQGPEARSPSCPVLPWDASPVMQPAVVRQDSLVQAVDSAAGI
jgi:hypothetical protein